MSLGKGNGRNGRRRTEHPRGRTCADCRFLGERTGFLTTHAECLEPSAHARRISESDAACQSFQPKMVRPGLSLVRELTEPTRRAARELTRTGGEDARHAGGRSSSTEPRSRRGTSAADGATSPEDAELAALEARARAAEARAQAAEAEAALAEARARAARRQGEGNS